MRDRAEPSHACMLSWAFATALAANPLTYPADIRTRRLSFYGCRSAGPTVFTVLSSSKRCLC